jgi:hypothetical protein
MVLEDATMAGIGENAQLCIRQLAGEFERIMRRHHYIVIAIDDEDRMRNRRQLRGIALPPGLDRRNLGLNGFVADGRVEVLAAFLQATQESVGRGLAVAGLGKEQKVLWMLVGGARLAECVLQNGSDVDDAVGCVMPTLSADVARSNPQIRATYQRKMLALVRKMSDVLDAGPDRKQRAWSIIAMMVGAVAIAQAMPDGAKANLVLDSALQTATALIAAK